MNIINKNILKKVYPPRKPDVRKYDFGLLLVIGGGQFYTGSPALAAMAAFRAGCDMVQILAPKRAADIIAGFSPNLASLALKGKWLDKEDLGTIVAITKAAKIVSNNRTAVVIGGGLGRTEETKDTVLEYLKEIDVPCVIDADGIHAISKNPEIIAGRPFLITPHSHEFFVLTGQKIEDKSFEEKTRLVNEQAKKLKTTILLKGTQDIISSFGTKEIVLNKTGSSYMTKGGTGDTLAGIAGALLSKKIDCFTAAQAASFLNGMAGEMAAKKFRESMLATDLIEEVSNVLRKI